MTTTTLYQASIPLARRALDNLGTLFAKAADHFAAQDTAEADWLGASLAPDMFPLTRQIQVATDGVTSFAARLAGKEAPSMPDTETSVAELKARIAKTIAYLDSIAPASINGREDAEIIVTVPTVSIYFTGASYVRDFGLPNLFFHCVTAYAIMRHKGAPLGKIDFLGPIDARPNS